MPFMDSIQCVHASWQPLLKQALQAMDAEYLNRLCHHSDWLPGCQKIFAAFQMPREEVRFILLGESPYPRANSANGYAFWDAAVESIWSETGLNKVVNRATSLRNMVKMLLHARGDLRDDFSQEAIAKLDKSPYIQTASQLFQAFMQHGFLLLNASLVYSPGKVNQHAKHWRIFMSILLQELARTNPSLQLVLFGRIANQLPESSLFTVFQAEHPYNLSFVTNPVVLNFFKPFNLLSYESYIDRSR